MSNKRTSKRFTLSFGKKDGEAAAWLDAQPDKSAYLKALILEDLQKAEDITKETEFCGDKQDETVYPAV